mgnify:CR=1 FL=1
MLDLVYAQVVILLSRNILPLLDFEEKRFDEERNTNMFIIMQLWGVTYLGLSLCFLMTNKVQIIVIQTLSATFSVIGAFIMEKKMEGTFWQIIKTLFETRGAFVLITVFCLVVGTLIVHYVLHFGQIEILKAWHSKNSIQKEYEFILSKLEEAIIIKDNDAEAGSDDNSISYANKKGERILAQIGHVSGE